MFVSTGGVSVRKCSLPGLRVTLVALWVLRAHPRPQWRPYGMAKTAQQVEEIVASCLTTLAWIPLPRTYTVDLRIKVEKVSTLCRITRTIQEKYFELRIPTLRTTEGIMVETGITRGWLPTGDKTCSHFPSYFGSLHCMFLLRDTRTAFQDFQIQEQKPYGYIYASVASRPDYLDSATPSTSFHATLRISRISLLAHSNYQGVY